jgi:hypothetical protein
MNNVPAGEWLGTARSSTSAGLSLIMTKLQIRLAERALAAAPAGV